MRSVAVLCVLAGALAWTGIDLARAKTWRIEPNGTGDAPTIQAGIDSAAGGDVVLLAPGTFAGTGNTNVTFKGKAVTVESSAGAEFTTIDCANLGRGFVFVSGEGTSSVLRGVRIVNGYHAAFGGAVYCVDGSPTIENSIFIGSESGFRGGAIYCDASGAVITGNTFEGNGAAYGGALWCSGGSSLSITANEFRSNTAEISGGAVACRASAPAIADNRFLENTAANDGGAIFCDQGSTPGVSLNMFKDNTAQGNGGAIGLLQTSATIENNLFRANASTLGGGIYCDNFSAGPIGHNTFDENSSGSGAAVYCTNYSAPPISNNIVVNSPAGNAVDSKNDSAPLVTCCCFFNNAGGNTLPPGSIDGGGNFSEDPEFCGIDGSGNYYLQSDSPCAPGHTPAATQCGLIGAFPTLCGTTSAEEKTWGAIKSLYRGE